MKNAPQLTCSVMLVTLFCLSSHFSLAQAPDWNTHGTRADSSSLLGTSIYEDLRIITDSTVRVTVDKDGQTTFENNVVINGSIKVDTLQSDSNLVLNANLDLQNKWIHADSLRCRVIPSLLVFPLTTITPHRPCLVFSPAS